MKFLYIGAGDVFARHELGFIAALSSLGNVKVISLGTEVGVEKLKVSSDNGVWDVPLYRVPCNNFLGITRCWDRIRKFIDLKEADIIFATPRIPVIVAKLLSRDLPVILRLWSIRATKLKDNLRFGAYEDVFLFTFSLIANFYYILSSTYAITVDHATYAFAKRVYNIVANRVLKVYPPYGSILSLEGRESKQIPEIIDRGGYILSFTVLSKKGAYLKFEAKPHAIVLYLLAKKANFDVVLAGSSYEDWKLVLPSLRPPKSLHIIGRGFSDSAIAKMYRNALLVVSPITNRNISNRLLEALFYGKATITTEVVRFIHPELKHEKHIYVSTWDTIVEDSLNVLRNEEMLKMLEHGAKEAYAKFFSTKHNIEVVRRLLGD